MFYLTTITTKSSMKKFNFGAGPAILPKPVFEKAAEAVLDYEGSGLSLLEISHRTDTFEEIIFDARQMVKELYGLSDDFDVLFLSGGASSQFYMVPFNLLAENGTAAYLETGRWAENAVKEAGLFGNVDIVASSKKENYSFIPKNYLLPFNATYFHITTNNTVAGTQLHQIPEIDCPIVADMSSDIFSKPLSGAIQRYGLIYAGAQKNVGAAGTTLLIVRKDLLGKTERQIPTMIDYRTHIAKESMFNTPPVFPVYVCYLTLQWVKKHGLAYLAKNNKSKADYIYEEIDRNPLFEGNVAKEDRSMMNVTFHCKDQNLEPAFLDLAKEWGCVGLKGHRSVGGLRASIYNAMDFTGVEILVALMRELEAKFG